VLVTPFGRTSRIEELGGWTALMLILGIRTYPGLRTPSFAVEVWLKLMADAASIHVVHTTTDKKRPKGLMENPPDSQRLGFGAG
jgi:hypothetical protein